MPHDTGFAAQVGRIVPRFTAGASASQPARCRLVRGWHVAGCYFERLGRASPPCTLEEDASLQSLQSTYCQGNLKNRLALELEACALPICATCIEPRTRHACTERNTSCPRRRWLAVAGITCLEWRIGLAPMSPAVGRKPPPFGMPGHPDMTRTGVVNPCTSRDDKTTDVPFLLPTQPRLPSAASEG